MTPTTWMLATLLAAPGAADSVQQSISAENEQLIRCFEENQVKSGSLTLRFRVGPDQRAAHATIETEDPAHEALHACLLRTLERIRFEARAVGAEVAYPVRYEASEVEEQPAPEATAARGGPNLSIVRREAFLIDDWRVVDRRGAAVSDLDLARISGDVALHEEMTSKRSRLFTYSALEAALAAASLVVAGTGAFRLIDDPARPSRGLDAGLVIGGGALSVTAGGLCLYHLLRALDVDAGTPAWHHLEIDQAERLIARANGDR